jgi:conjugative relaxase-like TrwC/TraI family protein
MAASLARLNTSASTNYYAKDNYYTKEEGIEASEWWGKGANYLNLKGAVEAEKFKNLMDGKDPEGNFYLGGVKPRERINKETGKKELHRSGIDVTFAPPKSVSIAALLDDRKDIENAHKNAVNLTLKEIEKNYSTCRVGGRGNQTNKICGNLIVAKFEHDTSRSKDPQLHTHCVIISAVRKPDGEWRRINNDVYFDNSKLINDTYLKNLRDELQKCNVKTIDNPKNKSFEIEGYDNVIIKNFSKQTQKIETMKESDKFKEALKSSINSGRDPKKAVKYVERKLKMEERDKKEPEQTREELKENWKKERITINKEQFVKDIAIDGAAFAANIMFGSFGYIASAATKISLDSALNKEDITTVTYKFIASEVSGFTCGTIGELIAGPAGFYIGHAIGSSLSNQLTDYIVNKFDNKHEDKKNTTEKINMRRETKEKVLDKEMNKEYGKDYDVSKHTEKDKSNEKEISAKDLDKDKGKENEKHGASREDKQQDHAKDNKEQANEKSKKTEIDFSEYER